MDKKYIVGQNTRIPILNGKARYTNLDNATSTPPLLSVKKAIDDFMPWYSSVHRGSGTKSRLSTHIYEHSRRIVEEFVGANQKDHVVIFGKNTTEAINKLANRFPLKKSDIVLISDLEHHSNDLPWRDKATVRRIAMTSDGAIDPDDYIALLKKYEGKIKLVSITGASNVTGYITPISWFARLAHEHGAQIAVDGAQLAAHRKVDMKSLDDPDHIDFLAIAGHKMYAPFGAGVLIGRRDIFEKGAPEYTGGGTIRHVDLNNIEWADTPDRDEAGSPNVIGAMALARSMKTLKEIGLDKIAEHEVEITKHAIEGLKKIPNVKLYGSLDTNEDYMLSHRSGVVPFLINNTPANLVAAILGYEWGIAVRNGLFCAHPYMSKLLNADIANPEKDINKKGCKLASGLIRASFGLYNTIDEIDYFLQAIKAISEGKYAKYELSEKTRVFTPIGFKENMSDYFEI